MPIMLTAYTCHANVPQVYCELKRASKVYSSFVLFVAFVIASAIYVFAGIVPYMTFGATTEDNILKQMFHFYQMDPDSLKGGLVPVCEILTLTATAMVLGISLIIKTPLIVMPIRAFLLNSIGSSLAECSTATNIAITISTIGSGTFVALTAPDLSLILQVTGAVAGNLSVFVAPGLLS
eukprot:GHVN01052469.1.p1 GENE.GHVN01052469.1~~GHVN01052469.1.p1  ORF type:complete len:208 (-),score=3.45 GHVN01052469.1:135-671(-)